MRYDSVILVHPVPTRRTYTRMRVDITRVDESADLATTSSSAATEKLSIAKRSSHQTFSTTIRMSRPLQSITFPLSPLPRISSAYSIGRRTSTSSYISQNSNPAVVIIRMIVIYAITDLFRIFAYFFLLEKED